MSRQDRDLRYYISHRDEILAKKKKQIDERKADGACIGCPNPPPPAAPGHIYCEECLKKKRKGGVIN
jgi:hypothetical protein